MNTIHEINENSCEKKDFWSSTLDRELQYDDFNKDLEGLADVVEKISKLSNRELQTLCKGIESLDNSYKFMADLTDFVRVVKSIKHKSLPNLFCHYGEAKADIKADIENLMGLDKLISIVKKIEMYDIESGKLFFFGGDPITREFRQNYERLKRIISSIYGKVEDKQKPLIFLFSFFVKAYADSKHGENNVVDNTQEKKDEEQVKKDKAQAKKDKMQAKKYRQEAIKYSEEAERIRQQA